MKKPEQQSLFDLQTGEALKEEGIARASAPREDVLSIARQTAVKIAAQDKNSLCDIDRVQKVLMEMDISLGMAAGAVFRGECWEFVGTKKSARTSNHARPVSVWRLKT